MPRLPESVRPLDEQIVEVLRVRGPLTGGQVADALGPQKLTLISVPGVSLPTRELQELGVARVSTGPYTQRVALTALQDAVAEVVAGGVLPPGTRALN